MPECQNCGSHVTADFARVFGETGTDRVHGCPGCLSSGELFYGGGAERV